MAPPLELLFFQCFPRGKLPKLPIGDKFIFILSYAKVIFVHKKTGNKEHTTMRISKNIQCFFLMFFIEI